MSSKLQKDFKVIKKLQEDFLQSQILPAPNSLWKHYKGGVYRVIDNLMFEEDCSPLVRYENVDHSMPMQWARRFISWNETVKNEDGVFVPRFMLIKEQKD